MVFQKAIKALVFALPIVLPATVAICGNQEWGPSSSLPDPYVGADFTHDDGGALIIACNTKTKLMSFFLIDPRADWKQGEKVNVTTRADSGAETGPTTAIVMSPHMITVGEQSTWHISTMGHAATFFGMGDGVYARVFLVANLRKATAPVLQACGDHW